MDLNEKEREVAKLICAPPVGRGMSIAEATELLDVSPTYVYNYRKQLIDKGYDVPKRSAGRPPSKKNDEVKKPGPVSTNGNHMSVEVHVEKALAETRERAEEVASQIEALQAEANTLSVREGVLSAAAEILTKPLEPVA